MFLLTNPTQNQPNANLTNRNITKQQTNSNSNNLLTYKNITRNNNHQSNQNLNMTNITQLPNKNQQQNPYYFQQKMENNRQLLLMYLKLQQVQQSVWTSFFRFEKSQFFTNFDKKLQFKQVFRLRLDDIIYLILLAAILIIFAILPTSFTYTTTNQTILTQLVSAYRYLLVFLFIFSVLWLISTNGYRHWIFLLLCFVFPLITFLIYNGIIPFGEIDKTTTTLFSYLNILSLWGVYIALYVIYPIKQFVRNKIGSLYSYLYALSTVTLFLIWPAYSLIQELSNNFQITYTFITNNRALIIAFLCIIVFTFHLLTHSTFFQGKLEETKNLLKLVFKQAELTKALQQIEIQEMQVGEDSTLHPINRQNNQQQTNNYLNKNNNENKSKKSKSKIQSFLYRNFTTYSRIMSLIVFGFTIAIQIYVFLYLVNSLTYIIRSIAVMVFYIGFLVYGCIINTIPLSRQATLYMFTVISIVPAAFSALYCNNCSNSTFSFYQYIFLASSLPYTTIFWCIVRSLSKRKPFLRTNILVIMYIFIHIPLSLFMLNSLQMISSDSQTVIIFNYIVLGIVGILTVIGLLSFIIWLCVSVKQLPKQQKQIDKIIDYNYYQQGNPLYIPYKKKQSFSLTYLALLDIRNLAQLIDCIAFIVCQLITMYVFNYINNNTNLIITSNNAKSIIYSQFYISFVYFTYSYCYITFHYKNQLNIIILIVLAFLGLFGIIFSYLSTITIVYSFRVAGSTSLAIFIAGIGLHIVKIRNKDIINFLSGVLVILLWIFLIIPYAIALPIISAFIDITEYGNFIYICILGTTLLLIILVSAMSIVFNVLMNKFQQQKKAKFMLEDVQTYLRQEGIQTQDQVLHIMYQSFQYRDQKYVYFMKKGYPIRLYKDPQDPQSNIKTIVYNYDNLQLKQNMEQQKLQQKQKDYCWACLTCICGYDDDQLNNKVNQISKKNIVDQQQMQQLVPEEFFKHIFVKAIRKQNNQKKYMDLSKLYSSKSIVLRHLTHTDRHTGEQFAILKSKKDRRLGVQIWHAIFNFLANQDDAPAKIIFNDFLIFCSLIEIPQIQKNTLNDMFLDFATAVWKNCAAIDINDFSLIVEHLTHEKYPNTEPHQDYKFTFLIQAVYPRLCEYAEFQDALNQGRIKKTKFSNSKNASNVAPSTLFSQNQSGFRSGQVISKDNKGKAALNLYSTSEQQLNSSPFMTSFQKYKIITQKIAQKKLKYQQKKAQNWQQKLIQPAQQQKILPKIKQQPKIKQKSCKKSIYQKYQACKSCCKKVQQQQQIVLKRKNVKPWQYLAVQSIRILEHKQGQWKQQNNQKYYQFRLILNNFLIAVFKLADLYTYLQITIMNPVTGWQSMKSFSVLLIQYKIQLYISFAVVLICAGFGIKGIQYIFQDRLGLTQTRIPAVFPHPMFFFTFVYKLIILSLFNTIIMTLLSTFMCDWTTSSTNTFYMILSSANQQIQCFSSQHNIYIICSLIAIVLYYPLSAYTMPNFQFAEKRLDLKYKPSFLIIYFQVNFILAAGKVLLSQAVTGASNSSAESVKSVQILFQSINIFCIGLLAICVIFMRPCLILWFNVIQFLVIWIGFVWNVFGLVLYLTQLWILCIIASSAISIASIILAIIFIRRRYFGDAKIQAQANEDQIGQLELGWKYKKQYNVEMVKYGGKQKGNKEQYDEKYTIENQNKYQINVSKEQNKDKDKQNKNNKRQNRPSFNNFTNDDVATNIGSHKKIQTVNIQNLLLE